MKALIVEDDQTNKDALVRLISRSWKIESIALEIVAVSTLAEAMKESKNANVTILDLGLPDSSPENTIEHISQFPPPVIVLTGESSEDVTMRCRLAGADHVFVKSESHNLIPAIFEAMQKDIIRRATERITQENYAQAGT